MKIHTHLIDSMMLALDEIFDQDKYADKVIEKLFKQNRKWGSRDRRFVAETLYDIVRNLRFYETCAGSDDSIDLIAVHLIRRGIDISDFEEDYNIQTNLIKENLKKNFPAEVRESFPDWLHQLGQNEFKEEWPALMRALNAQADVYLRVNSLKATRQTVVSSLEAESIPVETLKEAPYALRLKERKNVFTSATFKKGFFEVQDVASQFIAPLLDPQPGDRVADACAGAGGKSLHLAMMMKNKGKIIAMDIHDWKLQELKKRAARNGVDIIETKVIESTKTIKRLEGSFDRVLLDVPCSGLGVLRRNPDTKWKLSEKEIDRLVVLQQEILQDYSKMVKSNGCLVYATCSILHRENEQQVQAFLKSDLGKNWKLSKEIRLWPHKDHSDGFYAALLQHQG